MDDIWPWIWGGALALACAVICIFAIKEQNAWEDSCVARGGTVSSHTSYGVGTGVSSNGQVVSTTTSDTTYFCLQDGRVLDIK